MSRTRTRRMHADETDIDIDLVRGLLREQFPRWAEHPIAPVHASGTVNAIYRLGDDLAVRLPRRADGADGIAHEQRWLPILAPLLPIAVPEPVGIGRPTAAYPYPWSVFRWLEGETPDPDRLTAPTALAEQLATVVAAFRSIDRTDGSLAHRGGALSAQDSPTRAAIAQLGDQVDQDAVTAAWEASLRVAEWQAEPVWVHADLMPAICW